MEYSPLRQDKIMIDVYLHLIDDLPIEKISERLSKKGWMLYDVKMID
jgi:hypothetical protein